MIKDCLIAVAEEICPEKIKVMMYNVYEELLDINSIHDTTTGTDIFKGVETTINKKNLRWKNLKSITTDGGKNKGMVALVSKAGADLGRCERCDRTGRRHMGGAENGRTPD
ncbi:unnamed protein product [Chilo suppressalis]|uniref:DUF4371 domain-containing protein n=1 Tax=Chilo suppressalis TaxID=168631 RepID=A0ABN8BD97_CHISP|nr:unnamed protein product [Chilo suppressalis]